jgi:hypothetical protein
MMNARTLAYEKGDVIIHMKMGIRAIRARVTMLATVTVAAPFFIQY